MSKEANEKQNNPVVDFGFHIVVPRVVRTGYKNVSLIQKWLYSCLKDLCGDHGTCYRSLRVLSEETGFSTGMLSESIPALHKAGLIHAEKKRRSSGGKEVWHITIIDIWQENAKTHPTKRSQHEQTQNVHNTNVHNMNNNLQVCSQDERECSQCETEVIPLSNNSNEAITIESVVFDRTNTPPLSLSQEEIELILSLRSQNTLPHQGFEQTHNAPPFSTDPVQGDASESLTIQDESPLPVPSNSAQGSATGSVAEDSHATLSGVSNSVSQRDSEPSTTHSIEASELHIACTTSNAAQSSKQEKPPRPERPVMPPAEMKWSAEKLVQITEARRFVSGKQGAYFDEGVKGRSTKSQRQRQIDAAKAIIAREITEIQYIAAYDDVNDEWWNENKGSVTVETMAANTPRKIMRVIEITEKLESRSATIPTTKTFVRPSRNSQLVRPNKTAYTDEEMKQLRRMTTEQRKVWLEQRRIGKQAQAVGQ